MYAVFSPSLYLCLPHCFCIGAEPKINLITHQSETNPQTRRYIRTTRSFLFRVRRTLLSIPIDDLMPIIINGPAMLLCPSRFDSMFQWFSPTKSMKKKEMQKKKEKFKSKQQKPRMESNDKMKEKKNRITDHRQCAMYMYFVYSDRG